MILGTEQSLRTASVHAQDLVQSQAHEDCYVNVDGWMDVCGGGWMRAWVDGWIDGCVDVWMDRQTDRRTDGQICTEITCQLCFPLQLLLPAPLGSSVGKPDLRENRDCIMAMFSAPGTSCSHHVSLVPGLRKQRLPPL